MATLTSNDEQAVCGGDGLTAEELADIDEAKEDIVANKKEFFHEIDEVREALKIATTEALPHAQCRVSCERIGQIWSQYQEQPALLDPFMEEMVEALMCAIAAKVRCKDLDNPNLHLLSSLMYLLTTVRGYKTVVRLFPHEAADLEPCLEAAEEEAKKEKLETWSTLYCLTLWLGMVLLTPFDLTSIDSGHGSNSLSARIYTLALQGLKSTSRTRDASAWMFAKFFGRPDISGSGLLQSFLTWTRTTWMDPQIAITAQVFVKSGVLQAWNQTLKLAPRSVMTGLWTQVLRLVLDGPSGAADKDFGALSNLRKLRVSVACRAAMVILPPRLAPWRYERGARSLLVNFAHATGGSTNDVVAVGQNTTLAEEEEEEEAPEEIEEVVELLLSSLSDKDTIVRWAAAKAVGRITNRLSRDFGDQVLESLLERCFSFRESDKAWHGGCLALAELTRRGLLLPERLAHVMPLVCRALHFEEVSGNHTLGQHVRDAACYVCWAFARAFPPEVLQPYVLDLASALIQVAVFDREINCRRAAAAAVQENVGRQGTFPNGIEVVTVADYWTLSGRRQAYLEVAPQIAALGDGGYRKALIEHLVDRKLAHQDMQIRLLAAQGLAKLAQDASEETLDFLNSTVLPKLLLRANDAGGTANGTSNGTAVAGGLPVTGTVQARHGAVEGAAALTEVLKEKVSAENQTQIRNLVPALEKARAYRGRGGEVIRQAACRLLGRIADTTWTFKDATAARYLQTLDECARHTTESIQVAATEALKVLAAKRFKEELLMKCVDNYLQGLRKQDETIAARRGFALSLGALGTTKLQLSTRQEVLHALKREALGEELPGGKDQDDPTTRQYAVLSLGCICIGIDLSDTEVSIFLRALEGAMQDYATDRRGDVGSWVREVAMEVLTALLQQQRSGGFPRLADAATSTRLMALLLQQGVEKIDRLRERAYGLPRMLCHGHRENMHYAYRRVLHGEAYDAISLVPTSAAGAAVDESGNSTSAWPPSEMKMISRCLETSRIEITPMAEATKADLQADRNAAVFDALAPLIGTATYRSALLKGIVVSVGGITEHTAKDAKRALLRQLNSDAARHEVCSELLHLFESLKVNDADVEAKRFLAPLLNTLGILMAQDAVPSSLAPALLQRTVAAVQLSRDVFRLRSSIHVFVGLMRWTAVRCQALEMLLQFLGYSFPMVRQATAHALYIRFLEEEGDLDLSVSTEAPRRVPSNDLHCVSELLSLTPWATDETETLQTALKTIYEKLKLELPQGGRSILAPKKVAAGEQRREAHYADLVRENHF